ncbi:hypothetical protein GDO78_016272 [Eleutherodactylus coqui]|uniref:Ig-like domain-containing protein n=1 Tax=Eleutherodactylus coqui TaxID=57060 RepID=A0A8J6BF27_ELECQ|nr:hypothetical protein GDO78_016272 [Eleutherodactylus coqui]
MSWFLILYMLITCSYSMAQVTVIQERMVSVSPGTNIQMTCGWSEGSVVATNYPKWVYQEPGRLPQGIIGSNGNNHNLKPPTTSDRFTGSISSGSAVLSISGVQANDDGVYYCVLWTGSAYTVI